MRVNLKEIPLREALHYLGWKGTPLDRQVLCQIEETIDLAKAQLQPAITLRSFAIEENGAFAGTSFVPQGEDVRRMLAPCGEAVLMAATLGAQSERLLLRAQVQDSVRALLLDAVLSAAIEAVLDEQEAILRKETDRRGLYLTDRFSPGYGDMPLLQTKEICEALDAQRKIGLTVASSGIMIPRKSVTAVMGVSRTPVRLRPRGCAGCEAGERCALRKDENSQNGKAEAYDIQEKRNFA